MLLVIASFALLVFAFAGCGGDDNSSADTTTTETTTTEDTETTETETTETETTTEDTDTDTTSALGDFATSENCKEFQELQSKASQAFTGSGAQDVEQVKDQLQAFADEAPDEIKDDFQTLADGYGKIADLGLTSTNPDPQALAKLSQLGTEWATKMTTAGTNIATWVAQNCTG
jgi:hypothetical protein